MTDNKARVAAQTASVGNKNMMTFMPSSTAESSSQEGASSQSINIDNNDQLHTNVTTGDTSGMVPDPLLVRTVLDRGESMDDFTFNASLDALLTDDPGSYDNSNDITQQGIILPQPPTPAATAMETLINGGINVNSDPLLDSSAAAVGGGRKRKAPPTRLLSDMSSITNSSGSSEIPRLSSAPLLQQGQQSRGGGSAAPVQQQLQAAAAPNLNYSARSIIQLPPGMFANQQPISVSTTACPGPTVQQGVGNTNISQLTNRLYSSSAGVGGGVGLGGAQQLGSVLGNTAGVQQQQAIQVASLTIPPHNSSTTATSGASSGMADLMSQISLPTTQNSTQVQGQSSSQVQGQLQIPGISTNPWDALMANAATSAVQQPSTASALQQAVAAAYPSQAAAALPSAVPSSLSAAKGQRRPSLPKAPLLSNNMQRKRPYQQQGGSGLAVSEDESERKKRRNERNAREQERSQKITERISELKNVLSEAGVHFKPDRYSTLVSVVSYIKTLQQRSALLDEEHRKLLDTIAGADKLVKANGGGSLIPSLSGAATATAAAIASKAGSNNPILPLSAKGIIPVTAATTTPTLQTHEKTANDPPSIASSSSLSNNDEEYLMFVKGIDYKSIFTNCGVALAIASVDGRFVDCNEEFLKVTNYTRTELLGDSPRRTSLPHPQDDNSPPSSSSLKPNGQKQQGQAVTVSTTASTNKSSPLLEAVKKTPDVPSSNSTCSHDSTSSPPPTTHSTDGPPKEIHMRKQHLSLFNLLGGKDMEAVYSAMSRMLRAPEHYSSSTAYESGGTSSSDSFVKSDLTRSGAEESSSGNEGKREDAISRYTVDHWSGQVVHTRRKNHMLQLNISLVRTATGRPKFFNVSLSEVEKAPEEVKV